MSEEHKTVGDTIDYELSIRVFNCLAGKDWDIESRAKCLDDFIQDFFTKMHKHGESSSGLKEVAEFYKVQGRYYGIARRKQVQTDSNVQLTSSRHPTIPCPRQIFHVVLNWRP